MSEPIKRFELSHSVALVYETGITKYQSNEDGEVIATLPFPVDEKIAALALLAYQAGHNQASKWAYQKGRKDVIEFIHEILGVDKLIDRVGTIAEAHA